MTIQLDETKVLFLIISAAGVTLWFFFTHWINRIENEVDKKVSKEVCEVKHDKE